MSAMENTNEKEIELTHEQFKDIVKEYKKTQEDLKKINTIAKNIRTKKAELEKLLNVGMKSFSVEEINLKDGSIISSVVKTKSVPMNKKWVEQRIRTIMENNDGQLDPDTLIDYICNPEHRQTEEITEKIKYKLPKQTKPKPVGK